MTQEIKITTNNNNIDLNNSKNDSDSDEEIVQSEPSKVYKNGELVSSSQSEKMGHGISKNQIPQFMKYESNIPDFNNIEKIDLNNVVKFWGGKRCAFVLKNVYNKQECRKIIKLTESIGYEDALVNIGYGRQQKMLDVRNNKRVMIDSKEMAHNLFQRILPYLPKTFRDRKLIELNERLRFLRYNNNEYFAPHFDGQYRRKNGDRSFLTILFYLNKGYKGGRTNFINFSNIHECKPVPIDIGTVLVFQHDLFHEGAKLLDGTKYIMRTDVMYSNKTIKQMNDKKKKKMLDSLNIDEVKNTNKL